MVSFISRGEDFHMMANQCTVIFQKSTAPLRYEPGSQHQAFVKQYHEYIQVRITNILCSYPPLKPTQDNRQSTLRCSHMLSRELSFYSYSLNQHECKYLVISNLCLCQHKLWPFLDPESEKDTAGMRWQLLQIFIADHT